MIYWTWFNLLGVLLSVIAVVVCVWAYRRSRKLGYMLIAAGVLFGVVTMVAFSAIHKARVRAWYAQHQLAEDAHKAFMEESNAIAKKYFPAGNPPTGPSIHFPVGAVLALTGLWLLARAEGKIPAEPDAGGHAAEPHASA
ncbi:MAG: hypothetical protein PCFJNLEI_04159 [Verrucomicrobiae bacterium]|nr:hypothetical protein [Verrucomicrobiae bacterium]